MPTIIDSGYSCECCALLVNNDDTTGCENNCQGDDHVERLAQYGVVTSQVIVDPEPENRGVYRCAGCGDDTYGNGWPTSVVLNQ